jgi:mannose-1-phosphate guanylyltransferase/mannose-6-phosphate isomerase
VTANELRPWGGYEILTEGVGFKVKRIWVKPGEILSLQSHNKREEHWTIIKGKGLMELGEKKFTVEAGTDIKIRRKEKHRIGNIGEELLEFIEVQLGEYLGEDDIIRYADKYGRK